MTDIDTNVEHYTTTELLAIIGLENEEIDKNLIMKKTNELINKFTIKKPEMAIFFKNVQKELLLRYDEDNESDTEQSKKYLNKNKNKNKDKNNKVTEGFDNMMEDILSKNTRKNVIFGNHHTQMNNEEHVSDNMYSLSVKKDILNPNLKNTINRFVNLDSQFRQYTSGADSISTDYTLDLSDTLKNALSLRLYSYQIPYSWYAIDKAYGNTCFWIVDTRLQTPIPITVPPGNYSPAEFVTQLNASFTAATIGLPTGRSSYVSLNSNSGLITLYLNGSSLPSGTSNYTANSTNTQICFYDFTGILQCNASFASNSNQYFNNTLGWIMGYRLPYVSVDPNGNTASAILDLNGPKYLILVLDDYNQNHVNNGLVSITQTSNRLKMPAYYSQDLPCTCLKPGGGTGQTTDNLGQLVNSETADQNGLLIAGKYEREYMHTQTVLPSAPRTLTQAQIYTINEINKNNNNLTNYLAKAPTSSDILAILPVKTSASLQTGSLLVEFSGSLQDNSRTYFGPVNIDRMGVRLLDDKGNVLNLNGNDWCCTLICECLYQY